MSITRTINPLHFEDLEPHRFEDLVRQLIYDFKDWKSIEATGKLGSDDGIDILAIENAVGEINNDDQGYVIIERTWIIQCKREQNLSPSKIKKIIDNDLDKQRVAPYGYMLVASSNFSKKSRDMFKQKLNENGVSEFYIYGKAELEDLLFLPKYDHLLFAYFGFSLQKRSRSLKSNLTALLTTKKKLVRTIGEINNDRLKPAILIKPTQSNEYPILIDDKLLNWRYYEFASYRPIDSISFVMKKYLAYIDWNKKEWDIIDHYDLGFPEDPVLFGLSEEFYDNLNETRGEAYDKWEKLDDNNKGFYIEVRSIPFDRIVLIDEIGDAYNSAPHIIVDYVNDTPFEKKKYTFIESKDKYSENFLSEPKIDDRIKIF